MATFVVCTRCGMTQEIAALDQLPKLWQRSGSMTMCPRCATRHEAAGRAEVAASDILDEEVIYPRPGDDTLDDDFES